ncbi:MAG: fructose-1,6-bisphosphatase [bacterium]
MKNNEFGDFSNTLEFNDSELKYLTLLSNQYPSINSVSSEIINLQAILNLPKGTEHFVSDIHGEYESFSHVLRNASGVIKKHINDIFGNTLRESEKKTLATLIYYPEQKIKNISKTEDDMADWYKIHLYRLILICKVVSSKYTRAKISRALPEEFAYIIQELLHEDVTSKNKENYYSEMIDTIIRLNQADRFIIAISCLIQRLAIYKLHIIGDIYDRGSNASKIMDCLMGYHNLDIQWGNHDISFMGASAGCQSLICNVVRIQARYCNLDTLEEDYGINMLPLATFAMEFYGDDPCLNFMPKKAPDKKYSQKELNLISKMHKAITIIQFKLEGQLIKRRPEFEMQKRLLLDKINIQDKSVNIEGVVYKLEDTNFPTLDPKNPYDLTPEEDILIQKLTFSFKNSPKLQQHVNLFFSKGSIYTISNGNLLFHGGIPLNEDGTVKKVKFMGQELSGRKYLDLIEAIVRKGYFYNFTQDKQDLQEKQECLDAYWYLWCNENSPLFGKTKMTVFERYFIKDKSAHFEEENNYYKLRDDENMCINVLKDFGLDAKTCHIINGHVPVKVSKGESPLKANGRMFVIDGGFAKAYQSVTGIAGYTLIFNSQGMHLVSHEPFESTEKAIENEIDILSSTVATEASSKRLYVADTDGGKEIKERIKDLENLLVAYHKGVIK